MGSLRDKLGLHKPKLAVKTIRLPEPVPPVPPATGKPPTKPNKPPVVATELVKASCGHQTVFELYEEKKDKFREQRRAKAAGKICTTCRQAKEQAEAAVAKERRQQKRLASNQQRQQAKHEQRLPDGASFQTVYDAERIQWSGTLTVRTDAGILTFSQQASGVFRLLIRLDQDYRNWLQHRQDTERQDCKESSGG